jgi:hypothetical protein
MILKKANTVFLKLTVGDLPNFSQRDDHVKKFGKSYTDIQTK